MLVSYLTISCHVLTIFLAVEKHCAVFTYVVGGQVRLIDTCFFQFDM